MTYPEGTYDRREHAGVIVEIVQDFEQWGTDPLTNQDNAGTIYSWAWDFDGDKSIRQPDTISGKPYELADEEMTLAKYFADYADAALTIPLYFADYGSSGARIYESDDPNCVICFTAEEIAKEWNGSRDDAERYAKARIEELDLWMQGYVFGIVIRERDPEVEDPAEDGEGDVLESVWGFIGDPLAESGRYINEEANSMAEACAEEIAKEKREAFEMACRDVETVR